MHSPRFGILAALPIVFGPALASAANNPPVTAATLFDDRVLQEIRITMDPADWETMRANYFDSSYYKFDIQYRDVQVTGAGVKLRGSNSRNPYKPSLHLKFDKYVNGLTFLGMTELELKGQVQDASMTKELIAMKLFQRAGIPVPRESQSRLYVNGDYKGVYTIIESLNNDFLDRVFGGHQGFLYKYQLSVGMYYFGDRGTDIANYIPVPFELQNHKSDTPPNTIADMVQAINYAPDDEFVQTMARYLDWDQFLSFLSLGIFLDDVDGFLGAVGMNNFLMYQLPGTDRMVFLPWDQDNTFFFENDYFYQAGLFLNVEQNVLTRRALAFPELRAKYVAAQARNGILSGADRGWLQQEMVRLTDLIRASAAEDPFRRCWQRPCTNEDFEATVSWVTTVLKTRAPELRQAAEDAGFMLPEDGPRITSESVMNSASGEHQYAAGTLVSIYGDGLAAVASSPFSMPLPFTLGGAEVYVNGFRAPLLYASPAQINLHLPYAMDQGEAPVTVLNGGVLGNTVNLTLAMAAPGLFVAAHEDGTPVAPDAPARGGESIIVYATGLGPITTQVEDGHPSPGQPPAGMTEAVHVKVAGEQVPADQCYLTPGMVGVYEVHFTAPRLAPAGKRSLVVNSCGIDSPPLYIDFKERRQPLLK